MLLSSVWDTPYSLALIKDISNLWHKIVTTSGQNLMEGGERGSVACLHSYCTTSLQTDQGLAVQCSVFNCNECHAGLKCNKCHCAPWRRIQSAPAGQLSAGMQWILALRAPVRPKVGSQCKWRAARLHCVSSTCIKFCKHLPKTASCKRQRGRLPIAKTNP